MAADHPELRASDADRQQVIDQLRQHFGEGRLELHEFEERAGEAFAAKTMGELTGLLSDLPVLRAPSSGPPVRARPPRPPSPARPAPPRSAAGLGGALRAHLVVSLVLSVFFVLIWAGSGAGYFWPFWPILGIGVTVGIHAAVRQGRA